MAAKRKNMRETMTDVQTKQQLSVQSVVARIVVLALSAGLIASYALLLPAALNPQQQMAENPPVTLGALVQYPGCSISNARVASTIVRGRAAVSEGERTRFVFGTDTGTTLRVGTAYAGNCANNYMAQTLAGQRGTEPTIALSPVLGDINGDGASEIVVTTKTTVEAYSLSGTRLWTFTPPAGEGDINFSTPMLADFHSSHDGLDVLVTSQDGPRLHLHWLQGGWGGGSEPGSRFSHTVVANVTNGPLIGVADMTLTYYPSAVVVADDAVRVINNLGVQQFGQTMSLPAAPHARPVIAPKDEAFSGDIFVAYNLAGQVKIYGWRFYSYLGTYRLEALTGWPATANGGTMNLAAGHTTALVVRTNRDQPDIAFTTSDNKLNVLQYNGTPRPGFPVTLPQAVTAASQPIAADIDQDGKDEILVATDAWLRAYEDTGQEKTDAGFPLFIDTVLGAGANTTHRFAQPSIDEFQGTWLIVQPANRIDGTASTISLLNLSGVNVGREESWAANNGTNYRLSAYGYCFDANATPAGECLAGYGATQPAYYCNAGKYEHNCLLCGCPGGYYCNTDYWYCSPSNPPPGGGSPAILKAPNGYYQDLCEQHPNDPLCDYIQ